MTRPSASKELIVLVDDNGRPIGEAEKLASHHAHTPLHLAFSCYVFNAKGEVLVTRRAAVKKVWPGVWTNSVCGHPAPGETQEQAIQRRMGYELGMQAHDIRLAIPNYRYQTPLFKGVMENEYCPVFLARTSSMPMPNPEEVDDFVWMSWDDFATMAGQDRTDTWSWWCKDQLLLLDGTEAVHEYAAETHDGTMS